MAILSVVTAPDPRLLQVSKPIEHVDKELQTFIDSMLETMAANSSGYAAVQFGVLKRVFVLNVSSYVPECKTIFTMINPELTYFSEDTWIADEGCMSFIPIGRVPVERPENIKVRYLDYHGKSQELEASGWLGRGILHELDHLNGITLLHHVSQLKRNLYLKKLIKYKQEHGA